ncbi:MAG: hypothetical protein HXY41_08320 [Chloroflexi bacterium]|nr:hypothetical protein [Chloroflexota bacterium]
MPNETFDAAEDAAMPRPRSRLPRRLGCWVGLALWFVILLSPCALFLLATQGQITVSLGSAPEQTLRIWLINEIRERGIGISWAATFADGQDGLCVQTDTRFVLWAGRAENATFCACYTGGGAAGDWTPSRAYSGACEP